MAIPGLFGTASANDTIRVGIVGCGARGLELARVISERGKGVSVAAVCDASTAQAEGVGALTGAETVRRWQDLIERRDIDAVVVAAPDHLHAPISIAAMECGKDVYCEKPMTLGLEEAIAFRDTASRTRRVVQIGAYQTSQPQWRVAREILDSGKIGSAVWCQGSYRPSAEGASSGTDADWRKYWRYSNGIAGERFYHKLAALLTAVGPAYPERVSAAGGVYAQDGREVPDSLVMTAEYANGMTIVLASSMANRRGLPAVIRGSAGSIELCGDEVRIIDDAHAAHAPVSMPCGTASLAEHVENWLTCIRSRGRCSCNEEIGCQAMVAAALAVESYRTGKTLRFDPHTERSVIA